ncbi:hypothetical protein ACI3E1_00660 [Ligilactobacillus sp. LYQ139]|uniref:hypothetical protein n=1 Tax=Ligilactobacillus sp. LYQ139 TaxID=3378800 RepID=UPI003853830F
MIATDLIKPLVTQFCDDYLTATPTLPEPTTLWEGAKERGLLDQPPAPVMTALLERTAPAVPRWSIHLAAHWELGINPPMTAPMLQGALTDATPHKRREFERMLVTIAGALQQAMTGYLVEYGKNVPHQNGNLAMQPAMQYQITRLTAMAASTQRHAGFLNSLTLTTAKQDDEQDEALTVAMITAGTNQRIITTRMAATFKAFGIRNQDQWTSWVAGSQLLQTLTVLNDQRAATVTFAAMHRQR